MVNFDGIANYLHPTIFTLQIALGTINGLFYSPQNYPPHSGTDVAD
jgi:hypothetical protein